MKRYKNKNITIHINTKVKKELKKLFLNFVDEVNMNQYLIFLRLHNQHPLGGVWRGWGRETYGNFISSYNINLSGNEVQPCKGNISCGSGCDHGT